jgi:hypothetical protein
MNCYFVGMVYEDHVQNLHISRHSYNNYGRLSQFLFVIDQSKKSFLVD